MLTVAESFGIMDGVKMKKFVKLIGRIHRALMVSLLFVVLVAMMGLPYWLWYQLWLYNRVFASAVLAFLFWVGFVAYLFDVDDDKKDDDKKDDERENVDSFEARRRSLNFRVNDPNSKE